MTHVNSSWQARITGLTSKKPRLLTPDLVKQTNKKKIASLGYFESENFQYGLQQNSATHVAKSSLKIQCHTLPATPAYSPITSKSSLP